MTFIIIALCLFAERLLLDQESYRQPDWFRRYTMWSQQLPWGEWLGRGVTGIIVLLAPILLAVALMQSMFKDVMGGMPELIFAVVVLLYCLGPRDLDRQVSNYTAAWNDGEQDKAERIGAELIVGTPPQAQPAYARAIANGILEQACYRTFSVLFWFIILGPLGAALYRSSRTLQQTLSSQGELGREFRTGLHALLEILDWIPARITAATYAISGNFQDAILGWKESGGEDSDTFANSAGSILYNAGAGALGLNSTQLEEDISEAPTTMAQGALGLVWRSIMVWIAVLALITVTSWVS